MVYFQFLSERVGLALIIQKKTEISCLSADSMLLYVIKRLGYIKKSK